MKPLVLSAHDLCFFFLYQAWLTLNMNNVDMCDVHDLSIKYLHYGSTKQRITSVLHKFALHQFGAVFCSAFQNHLFVF